MLFVYHFKLYNCRSFSFVFDVIQWTLVKCETERCQLVFMKSFVTSSLKLSSFISQPFISETFIEYKNDDCFSNHSSLCSCSLSLLECWNFLIFHQLSLSWAFLHLLIFLRLSVHIVPEPARFLSLLTLPHLFWSTWVPA